MAIPYLLSSEGDFVAQAQTGTGKTAAFAIPLIERLQGSTQLASALILVPTRELAIQVKAEIDKLTEFGNINSVAIVGGESYDRQLSRIKSKKPQIIVGTPGRIMDLRNQGVLNFKKSQFLILDEADEMLKMGFMEAIEDILQKFNSARELWMFSATMPKNIIKFINTKFNNPHFVNLSSKSVDKKDIDQKIFYVKSRHHLEALTRIVDSSPGIYAMVFCQTKRHQ